MHSACICGGLTPDMLRQDKYRHTNLLLPSLSAEMPMLPPAIVEQFVTGELPRPTGVALVDNWDCLRVRAACLLTQLHACTPCLFMTVCAWSLSPHKHAQLD